MRYERWVQHNLIRDEGRLPALRELTQSAPVEKTAALSTELRGRAATIARLPTGRSALLAGAERRSW